MLQLEISKGPDLGCLCQCSNDRGYSDYFLFSFLKF